MSKEMNNPAPISIAIDRYYERSPEDLFAHELAIRPRLHTGIRTLLSQLFVLEKLSKETTHNLSVLQEEPGFVCPRHLDEFDIPVMGTALHWADIRPAYYLAKAELMDKRPKAWLLGHLGGVPVDRAHTNATHLGKLTKHILVHEERSVVGFPEGTRTSGDTVCELQDGIPLLARRNKRLIVPVGIFGTEGAVRTLKRGLRPRVTVVAAEPIDARTGTTTVIKAELHHRMQQAYDEARETIAG